LAPRIDWSKFDLLIGKMPDTHIARLAGVTQAAVRKRRLKKEAFRAAIQEGPYSMAIMELVAGRDFDAVLVAYGGEAVVPLWDEAATLRAQKAGSKNFALVAFDGFASRGWVQQTAARELSKKSDEKPELIDLTRGLRALSYWRRLILVCESDVQKIISENLPANP